MNGNIVNNTSHLHIGSEEYKIALQKESDYWGKEIKAATESGVPFSADMRRAQKITVNRGKGLPQQQNYDPQSEMIMNGDLYKYIFDTVNAHSRRCKVLVLTCGPGNLCLELAREGHDVTGLDISKGAIEIARKYTRENPYITKFGSLEYNVVDLNVIELDPDVFDFIIAWDGLHHILRLDRLLKQVHRALKQNGRIIFSDNIGMHWKSQLIGGALYFILPTTVSYTTKFKYVFGGAKRIRKEMTERSPFEEINTTSILQTAKKYFHIIEEKNHIGIGYRAAIAGDIRLPAVLKYSLLRYLKKVDDWLVGHMLLVGDHIFVIGCVEKVGARKIKHKILNVYPDIENII